MTREEFFRKLDEQLRIREQDGWAVRDKAWSVFSWAQRMRKWVNPSQISDDDIKAHLLQDSEITDYLRIHPNIDISDLVYRVVP